MHPAVVVTRLKAVSCSGESRDSLAGDSSGCEPTTSEAIKLMVSYHKSGQGY